MNYIIYFCVYCLNKNLKKKIKMKFHQLKNVILLFFFILLLSSCHRNGNNKQAYSKLVKSLTVKEKSSVNQKQFAGIIEESEEVNLAFRVAGPIQKIHVKEGDYVRKRQLVATMDSRDYEVQRQALETQVEQLRSEYERIAELNKRKSIADNDYEKMKAGKEMAETKLKNAIDQLNDTKLYAPFSGYITKVMFEDGELVNHGTPIASLVDVSMLKVEINVPASMYINKNNITEIYCTQEDIPGKKFPLKMYANNIKANSNGLYKFYLYYKPDKKSSLLPGMNVSVVIEYSLENSQTLHVPLSAIFENENQSYVWVIENEKVHAVKVETNSLPENGMIGVSEGLQGGEQIVIGGLNLLQEGESVKVMPKASETNVGNIL